VLWIGTKGNQAFCLDASQIALADRGIHPGQHLLPLADIFYVSESSSARQSMSALLLLLAAALFVAVWTLHTPLRSDEVWTLNVTNGTWPQLIARLEADIHPPLFYLLAKPWLDIFGRTETGLHSLSGLFYGASVLLLWLTARRLLTPGAALLAAAVFAASPFAFVIAGFGRMYSLLTLVVLLSLYAWVRARSDNHARWWALLACANAAGIFTHIWFVFYLAALGLWWLWEDRGYRFLFANAVAALPYAVWWLPIFLRQFGTASEAAAWIPAPDLAALGRSLFLQLGAALVLAPLALYGWWKGMHRPTRQSALLLMLAGVCLLLPWSISFAKPIFYERFTVVAMPLLALGLATLLPERFARPAAFITLCGGIAIGSIATRAPGVCSSRSTAEWLHTQLRQDDAIIFTSLSRLPVRWYLSAPQLPSLSWETSFPAEIDRHPGFEPNYKASGRLETLRLEAEQMAQLLSSGRTQRIILTEGFHPEVDALLHKSLAAHWTREAQPSLACPSAQCYFRNVSVWRRTTPASLRSSN
jgi:4-amino-4-deoxy-L-arabinose transferase-like glycosyltransferase